MSLKMGSLSVARKATRVEEQDAAVAAAELYHMLTKGYYQTTDGKRKKSKATLQS